MIAVTLHTGYSHIQVLNQYKYGLVVMCSTTLDLISLLKRVLVLSYVP
jgi:hypothetical protein